MTSATAKALTPVREKLWTALKGWNQYTEKIHWFAESDAEVRYFLQNDASLSRCPIITARWREFNPEWWVFSQQEWRVAIEVSVWVPDDRQTLSQDLIEDVIDAVFRHEAPGTTAAAPLPTLKSYLCRDPEILVVAPSIPVEAGIDGKHKLLQSYVVFGLTVRKDPKLRATA